MITFCLCEDRAAEEVGLRLAVCSLRRYCPGSAIVIYRNDPRPEFTKWLRDFSDVTLIPSSPHGASSWNCKPNALLPLLRDGAEEVVWLDSDVVLAGDPRLYFRDWDHNTLGVCEEYRSAPNQGSRRRTEGWGLAVGREFPRTLNSAVIRVTRAHIPLLERWQELLADSQYALWQTRPLHERPLHVWGDQDVLNALLGAAEFANVPVRLLRTGREIVHCGSATSYTARERMNGLFHSIPAFIHAQGAKPWVVFNPDVIAFHQGRFWTYFRLILQLSPYRAIARRYRNEVGVPCDWLDYWSISGRMYRACGLGHHGIRGLPLAVAAGMIKCVRRRG